MPKKPKGTEDFVGFVWLWESPSRAEMPKKPKGTEDASPSPSPMPLSPAEMPKKPKGTEDSFISRFGSGRGSLAEMPKKPKGTEDAVFRTEAWILGTLGRNAQEAERH